MYLFFYKLLLYLFNLFSCFFVEMIWSLSNLYHFLFWMPIKSGLFVLIITALVVRSSISIKRSCTPSGFKDFQPFMTFRDAEDTGLLGFYVLYSPPRPKKLTRCEMLLRTKSLIMILLLMVALRVTQVSFYKYYFFIILAALFWINFRKIYLCNLSLIALKVLIAY